MAVRGRGFDPCTKWPIPSRSPKAIGRGQFYWTDAYVLPYSMPAVTAYLIAATRSGFV